MLISYYEHTRNPCKTPIASFIFGAQAHEPFEWLSMALPVRPFSEICFLLSVPRSMHHTHVIGGGQQQL